MHVPFGHVFIAPTAAQAPHTSLTTIRSGAGTKYFNVDLYEDLIEEFLGNAVVCQGLASGGRKKMVASV